MWTILWQTAITIERQHKTDKRDTTNFMVCKDNKESSELICKLFVLFECDMLTWLWTLGKFVL